MKKSFYLIITLLLMTTGPGLHAQTDPYLRDTLYTNQLKQALTKDFEQGKHTPIEAIQAQLSGPGSPITIKSAQKNQKLTPAQIYKEAHPGVMVLGKLYRRPQDQDDKLYQATAFVIDPGGVCVSNYHVFGQLWNGSVEEKAMGVMDVEGNYYPIREVLRASQADDIVIFRIETNGTKLTALPLGQDPDVGSEVHIISHPANHFFYFSSGHVTRKYWYDALASKRISVSADFALGSSGGPILDARGSVIGVVAATISIPSARNQQMVAKEIIPATAIHNLLQTALQP